MTALDTKLLPCPFCGGSPDLYDTLPGGSLWYRCEECGGETEGGKTEADAIAAWNRRVSPSQGEGPAADVVREIWDAATNAVCQTMQDRGVCNCRDGHCVAAKIEPAQQDIEYFAALAASPDRDADGPYVTDAARYPG